MGPVWNIEDKICLVSDPRPTNPFNKTYSVDCLGNMVGGRRVVYNNQPVELLMDMARDSMSASEPVWFGCEDRGEKGYLLMTSDWFKEFVFEIVVDKKFVPKEVLETGELEPVVLPAWDPLGALAL